VIAVANRLLRYLTTAALILGSVLPLKAEMGPPVSADKKLIAFAQNQLVDTTYLREHIAESASTSPRSKTIWPLTA